MADTWDFSRRSHRVRWWIGYYLAPPWRSEFLRDLFRPRYGRWVEVRPRRWWSPRERKMARLAAIVCDYEAERLIKESVDRLILGEPFRG